MSGVIISGLNAGPRVLPAPANILGAWYMDAYVTSPRSAVVNAAASNPVNASLAGPARRNFTNTQFWTQSGLSITDSNATSWDGLTEASTITNAGSDWKLFPANMTTTLPAGTWTVGINVKYGGSGGTAFKLGDLTGTPQTFTATSSWQRFSNTFTNAGTTTPALKTNDAVSAANLLISDFQVFSGSGDLGPGTPDDSNIYFFPLASFSSNPVLSGGAIEFGTANYVGWSQLPAQSLSAFSVAYLINEDTNDFSNQSFAPIFADMLTNGTGWHNFAVGPYVNATIGPWWNGGSLDPNNPGSDPCGISCQGKGWQIVVITYDGTTVRWYMNGFLLRKTVSAGSSINISDLSVGVLQKVFYAGLNLSASILWNTALNIAQVSSVTAILKSRAIKNSISVLSSRAVFFEGDSISVGTNSSNFSGYSSLTFQNTSPIISGNIVAQGGSTISSITSRAATLDAYLPLNKNGTKWCLHVLIGTNDLGLGNGFSGNPSGFTAALLTYLQARRAAGWDFLVVGTIISRTDQADGGTQFDLDRATANTTIKGWVGTQINACSDFASVTHIGGNGDASNATYFSSGLHPTSTGYALMAPKSEASIGGLHWGY